MKIKVSKVMKAKGSYSSQRETVVTSSFRACSLAMDDGGRCLLDVINDPKLLQSFLESGSDDNSKDPQDGTSPESAVESPQVSRSSLISLPNNLSTEQLSENQDQMGYSYAVDSQALLAQSGMCAAATTTSGLGGMPLVVASSVTAQTYHHPSSSGATIHHIPSSVSHTPLHPHSPATARSLTPHHNVKSPSSVHSMPPPSPLQQTRSPLPSHTPSPAPAWSPAPPVLSPATSRTQSMPSVAFQQSHNQILQTSGNVTQFVTALANQQSMTPKLTLQQQQQLFLQQQLTSVSQQQVNQRLTTVSSGVVTTAVSVNPPVVQLIPAQSNVTLSSRTSHCTVRPIQPKVPPQILPKPATCSTSNQFVTPAQAPKPTHTQATTNQRTVGVGIQPGAPSQLVINQGQPGVFSGPSGTILLNQIIPGMGQSPIVIQGNLGHLANLPGSIQLTLRPQNSASPAQSLNSSNNQNNATLIAALQGPSQHTQTLFAPAKSPIHGQQTIVIPNNITHAGLASQNINLTSAAIPNSGILSSSSQGQQFLTRSNIILSPRVVGANHGLQFQQIQTPTGPIFFAPSQAIAVPHLQTATLGNAQLAPVTVPMHGVMTAGQGGVISLQSHAPQSALQQQPQQSLFGTAVPFTSNLEHSSPQVIQVPQPLAPPHPQQVPANHHHMQSHQIEHSPKSTSPPKTSKVPSVNLEELLKEHGIVPTENSPLPSPDCNSPTLEENVPQQPLLSSPQLVTALQSPQIVLEQPQSHPAVGHHLKLAVAQDGSVIIQPHNTISGTSRVHHYVSSGQVQNRTNSSMGSVILPTITSSVSVPVVTTETTSSRNHSALIARLNAAPAIAVPDVSSLALSTSMVVSSQSPITNTSSITTTATTLVPLTVQNLTVNNAPIVVQRTSFPTNFERVLLTEDIASHSPPMVTSTVQSRVSRTVVSSEQQVRLQGAPKTVQTSQLVSVNSNTLQSVQNELPKCIQKETTHTVKSYESSVAAMSHNHSSNVPNHILPKLQKEVTELLTLKYRSPDLQKVLEQLIALQHRITGQTKGSKICKINLNQNQAKIEAEFEKLMQKSQQLQSVTSEASDSQSPLKTHSIQQSNQLEKQPISIAKPSTNTNSLHLVNLLKQTTPHNVPVKHIIPSTTTVTTLCDSTTTQSVAVTSNQKINQINNPVLQRLQSAPPTNKSTSETTTQQQVIVRLQKPSQPQTTQSCSSIVQIKASPPVKKPIVNAVPKTVLISEQLTKDQNAVINPDVKTPFLSKTDACKRLMSYHVYNSKVPSQAEIEKADDTFAMVSVSLMDKMKRLQNKYHLLQLKESMRICPTPDQVLLERLFISDETSSLRADKAAIAEGKTLSLPPPPMSWLQKLKKSYVNKSQNIVVKEEPVSETDEPSPTEVQSDRPALEDSDPFCKEEDNLEAPVIDSCADIVVPPNDDSCERSPPTLKRIVIQNDECSDSESEEPPPPRKRLKFNNSSPKSDLLTGSSCKQSEPPALVCEPENSLRRLSDTKNSEKDYEVKVNHRYPLMTRGSFQTDDMVYEIRKELDMSPMEMDEDEDVSHIDFDAPCVSNHLADFEPPVARTDESCDSNLLYNNSMRTNCAIKYDFDLLSSDWTEEYAHPPPNETDIAVENIIASHHSNTSDLDLSGLDSLDEHLNDGQHCIPNGIQEDEASVDSESNFIGYRIPKHHKRFPSSTTLHASNCSSSARDQVQSAIKSIIGTSTESRSYFDGADFLSRHNHNAHITDFGSEVGYSSGQREPDLDEAVRSILL